MEKYIQVILTQKNILWLLPHIVGVGGIIGVIQMFKGMLDPKNKMKMLWKWLVPLLGLISAFLVMFNVRLKYDIVTWITISILYSATASFLYSHGKDIIEFIAGFFKKDKNAK